MNDITNQYLEDLEYAINYIEELREKMIDWNTIEKAIEEVKVSEGEQQEQNMLGDAWEGGFAANH